MASERFVGTCEKFFIKRGFGIIKPSDGSDNVFVHWTQILSEDSWPSLQPGMEVEYDVTTDDKGKLAAENVTMPGGGPFVGAEDPSRQTRTLSKFTVTGEVVFFKRDVGYGFLTNDKDITWPTRLPAGSQIYVGREELLNAEGSSCNLSKGMKVQFKVYQPEGKDGLAAAEVTGLGGAPLVYEPSKGDDKGKGKGKYGKGKSGKDSYGKDSYGKDSYGKDSYGKGSYGKDSYSKGSYGKDSYSKGKSYGKGYDGYSDYGDDSYSGGSGKGYGGKSSSYPGVQRTIQKTAPPISKGIILPGKGTPIGKIVPGGGGAKGPGGKASPGKGSSWAKDDSWSPWDEGSKGGKGAKGKGKGKGF